MKIVYHSIYQTEKNKPFEVVRGEHSISTGLNTRERDLLNMVGSAFSVIHGGHFKGRKHPASA